MQKIKLLLALVFIVFSINAQNLLVNPSFETWTNGTAPDGWTLGTATYATSTPSTSIFTDGTKSLKVTAAATAGGTYTIQQIVPITPGATYTLEMNYYIETGDGTDARIWCDWCNVVGGITTYATVLSHTDSLKLLGPGGNAAYFPDVKGSWQKYTCEVTAPATGYNSFTFQFRTYKTPAVVYWDKMYFGLKAASGGLSLTTQAAASVASTTATLNGTISSFDAGSAFVNSYGFCWNTTGTPTITDSKVDKGFSSTTGAYSHSISNLSPVTTYYVRSYATNGSGVTSYGGQVSFTTTTGLAAVSTQAATTIASTTATLNGTISSLGDTPVTAHGFCWSTTTSPTIANSKIDIGVRGTTGSMTSNISSLLPSTTYYVRSFATNNAGTTYGSEVNFTTTSGLATMSTQAASLISSTTTTLNGTIVSFDSSTPFVNSYGFCWNVTGTPTIADSKVDKGFSSTIGAFSHSISNLSPALLTMYVHIVSMVQVLHRMVIYNHLQPLPDWAR